MKKNSMYTVNVLNLEVLKIGISIFVPSGP
jgi:hypothetical protein